MSKPIKCPRCHGPATMIDKAPPGEKGDVIRCAVEAQCCALHDAARELETAHAAVADSALEFIRRAGKPCGTGGEIKIPMYVYADFHSAVAEWKDAGQALHDATVAYGLAARNAA